MIGVAELIEASEEAYPAKEELSNSITSAIGALLAIVGLYFLVTRANSTEDVTKLVTCTSSASVWSSRTSPRHSITD